MVLAVCHLGIPLLCPFSYLHDGNLHRRFPRDPLIPDLLERAARDPVQLVAGVRNARNGPLFGQDERLEGVLALDLECRVKIRSDIVFVELPGQADHFG